MGNPLWEQSKWKRTLAGVAFACALGVSPLIAGEPTVGTNLPASNQPAPSVPVAVTPVYGLDDCLQIAKEKQPKLVAVRGSLSASISGQRGLEDTRIIGCLLIPDLKFRRQQAAQGVLAGYAELSQAEFEVRHAVVWNYYSVIYAREQQKTVKELVDLIQTYRDFVQRIITSKDGGNRDINKNTLDALDTALAQAQLKAIDAELGSKSAYVALREAMGVPGQQFQIAVDSLPICEEQLNKEILVHHAQTRRGEVILAGIASEVSRLEVFAQWSIRYRLRTQTFASTSDIHHQLIPQGSKTGEYRPDAIAPEMPAHLVGNRENRTSRVQALSDRAAAVSQETKNLVAAEAEVEFERWEAAVKKAAIAKRGMAASKEILTRLRKVADDEQFKSVKIEDVIRAHAAYTEASANYNEALYKQIVSLSALERITAGGIIVNYRGRTPTPNKE